MDSEWAHSPGAPHPMGRDEAGGPEGALGSRESETGPLAELTGWPAWQPQGKKGTTDPSPGLPETHTWLLVDHVEQEEEDHTDGDEGRPPGEQEHDDHGDDRPKQRCPLAVVSERGSPPWWGAQDSTLWSLPLSPHSWAGSGWQCPQRPEPGSQPLPTHLASWGWPWKH